MFGLQLVTPLKLPPSPHDTQAKVAELQSQEAVQAALLKLQQLTVEASSLLPATLQVLPCSLQLLLLCCWVTTPTVHLTV